MLVFLVVVFSLAALMLHFLVRLSSHLPPGPLALPFIGHLHHLIIKLPHQSFHKLSLQYGPIMTIRLGQKTTILISSSDAAKEALTTHDRVFASHPHLISPEFLCYNSSNIGCSVYTPQWSRLKKMCLNQLFSTRSLEGENFRQMRTLELFVFMQQILQHGQNPVDVKSELSRYTMNVICSLVFGRRVVSHEFVHVILEAVELMGAVHIGDYIPSLRWLDPAKYISRLCSTRDRLDSVLQRIIDDYEKEKHCNSTNLIHTFLSEGIPDDTTKAVILDILAAGTDTTALTIEWALAELIKHPHYMQQLQDEILHVVGKQRLVTEDDLHQLPFLKAVVKETFRLHPAIPLLAPHYSTEDCTLRGYHIPKDSWIILNVWSIGRKWPNHAHNFRPERFLNSSVDVKGLDFELIPFGAGRRKCLGTSLALRTVQMTLARLVQAFNWSLPISDDVLDMEESQGVLTQRKSPLLVVASWRLPFDLNDYNS